MEHLSPGVIFMHTYTYIWEHVYMYVYIFINVYICTHILHRCIKIPNNKGRLTTFESQVCAVDCLVNLVCKYITLDNRASGDYWACFEMFQVLIRLCSFSYILLLLNNKRSCRRFSVKHCLYINHFGPFCDLLGF